MKNAVFYDMRPCCASRTDVSEESIALLTANVVPSSLIRFTLAIGSSKTSVCRRATRFHVPEDGILHSTRWSSIDLLTRPALFLVKSGLVYSSASNYHRSVLGP
jgi:hypothetical protein